MTERVPSTVTERLALYSLVVSDAPAMAGVLSDSDLYAYTGGQPPGVDELATRYRFQVAGSGRHGEIWHNWIVCPVGAVDPIGFIQATVIAPTADLAWVIGLPWQGRGYATEAASSIVTLLGGGPVHTFTAHIHPRHQASQSVARSLGMSPSGFTDDDGEEVWQRSALVQ